jgi:hypothetical protein
MDGLHESLRSCHGFLAVGEDGIVGRVETPVFPPDAAVPDYLVIRGSGGTERPRVFVASTLVSGVDQALREVYLAATVGEVLALPDRLPLARERGR